MVKLSDLLSIPLVSGSLDYTHSGYTFRYTHSHTQPNFQIHSHSGYTFRYTQHIHTRWLHTTHTQIAATLSDTLENTIKP